MDYRRNIVVLGSAGTLAYASLLGGCGDDSTSRGLAATGGTPGIGGAGQLSGGATVTTTGGATVATTGGSAQATGGSAQGTGGSAQATGGSTQAAGGNTQATGGGAQAAGGSTQAAGGSTQATGGATSGPEATCESVAPCGGDVVGTWTATGSCLSLAGPLNVMGFGVGCSAVEATGELTVTGSITFNADGVLSDSLSWSGEETLVLDAECLEISGTVTTCDRLNGPLQSGIGFVQGMTVSSVDCLSEAATGGCRCTVLFDYVQTDVEGTYTVAGNVITTDAGAQYSYCADGSDMLMTPDMLNEETTTTQTGTIALVNLAAGGGTGIGGTSGTGGSGPTGGSAGSTGGSVATGGTAGSSGGADATGGTSGSSGGAVETGGTAGSSAGTPGTGGEGTGGTSTGGQISVGERPCDIYQEGNTPCVGAYSMVRSLSSTYDGPLYQVRRGAPNPTQNTGSGGETFDVGMTADGFADAAAQDEFCAGETCTVSVLFDHSGTGNDLTVAPGGCYDGGDGAALEDDYESSATALPLKVSGHNVYGLYMNPHEGYRNNGAVGTAEGNQPQGVYMIADGTHWGFQCCWDFGNAARDTCFGPTGIMGALMFGEGYWGRGADAPPWFMGDFELGVWTGGSFGSFGMDDPDLTPTDEERTNLANPSMAGIPYAFGILSSESGRYALRMGDATAGSLTTAWDGDTEIVWDLGGAILLGVGGDNSNWSQGSFYEGAVTAGRPSPATDEAVYQNVRDAAYGQ